MFGLECRRTQFWQNSYLAKAQVAPFYFLPKASRQIQSIRAILARRVEADFVLESQVLELKLRAHSLHNLTRLQAV